MPDVSPVTVFETFVELEPEPALDVDVFDPYAVVVPYSKRYVVERPLGSTLPFSLTLVVAIELAADVTRDRRLCGDERPVGALGRAGRALRDESEVIRLAR